MVVAAKPEWDGASFGREVLHVGVFGGGSDIAVGALSVVGKNMDVRDGGGAIDEEEIF